MGDVPNKSDIQAIFKRLRTFGQNKSCFDCGALNPTWASVTYGVFLCIDCSAMHRSLGVHLTFIRSTQLDTNWTWPQLRAMQMGGNANATAFFRQHGCTTSGAQEKYHSKAAAMYKEKLHSLALRTQRQYGSKLHVDAPGHVHEASPTTKEVDFFKEHSDAALFSRQTSIPEEEKNTVKTSSSAVNNGADHYPNHGPKVEHVLSTSPSQIVAEPRKSTIGGRKPPSAKKGFGAKKGGLGAQKVKTNFSEIENEAQRRDQEQENWAKQQVANEAKSKEEEEKQMAAMRLAYKDLSLESKKREESFKNMDPKKREQMERLGMGFGGDRTVSHSAFSDMKTIEQEMPDRVKSSRRDRERYGDSDDRHGNHEKDFFEDEFEMVSKPPKYKSSPFSSGDDFGWGKSSSSWDMDRFEKKQSSTIEEIPSHNIDDKRKSRSRKTYDAPPPSDDAHKKFGNAKSISSDQFFGDQKDNDFEKRMNMARFDGSHSISSADYFGDGKRSSASSYNTHDLSDVKDSVKQGVTKVAGKLSNLASGVMSSLQDKYGY